MTFIALVPSIYTNVKQYGAKGDAKTVTDGAITSGTPTLTSASAAFTSADAGKQITVNGAGVAGANLNTTISAYVNATTVTLAASAGTTVTGATVFYATDDTATIQAAINAASAAGGGGIAFPAGTYLVLASLTISTPVQLVGLGGVENTILKLASGVNDYILTFTPSDPSKTIVGVSISGLKFDGNTAAQTAGGCILAQGAVQCAFDACHFLNPYDIGLRITNYLAGQIGHHNRVTRCLFDGGSSSAGNGKGLQMDSSDENYVAFNDFENCGGAGTEPYAIKDWSGIQNIIGNVFVGGKEGIRLQDVSSTRVISNTFDGVGRAGIHMSGSKNVVMANLFSNGSSASAGASGQCEIDNSTSCTVTGNSFTVTTSGQVRNCVYELSSSSSKSLIADNIFDLSGGTLFGGNPVVQFGGAASGTSKAANNPGYNPRGPLTAPSIPTSAVAYTNVFNIDCSVFVNGGTVSAIAIGGTSTGLSSGAFRIPAGQSITLTYTVAPSWTWFGD